MENLIRHKNTVHDKLEALPCKHCDYKTNNKDTLKKHIRQVHEKVKHDCTQCTYQSVFLATVRDHISRIHENVKYDCQRCNFITGWKVSLKFHMKNKHSTDEKEKTNAATSSGTI